MQVRAFERYPLKGNSGCILFKRNMRGICDVKTTVHYILGVFNYCML